MNDVMQGGGGGGGLQGEGLIFSGGAGVRICVTSLNSFTFLGVWMRSSWSPGIDPWFVLPPDPSSMRTTLDAAPTEMPAMPT